MAVRTAALASLVACATPTATTEQPIIHGTPDSGDAAVVMLVAYPTDHSTMFTCTAEVISATGLLTAGHCVDHPGYDFGVFTDADATAYTTLDMLLPHLQPVSAVHVHPQYDRNAPFTADIGIAVLTNATTIAPLPFSREAPTTAMVGAASRIIGYGQTTYGTYNAKREQAATHVAALDNGDTVSVGDSSGLTCVGDSGGPALVTIAGVEQIVGEDSYSDTTGCTQPAHFRRTDIYAPFIDAYAGTMPPATGGDAGVTPPGPDAGSEPAPKGGGCSTTAAPGAAIALLVLGRLWRRRRRRIVGNPILLA
jgi:MYXO-CTERM domain-containing protein